jgi:hypothetical protein
MHLRPIAGCQIPTLIFENKLWRGSLLIYHKNISRTAKFLPTFKNFAVLDIFLWDIDRNPLTQFFSNIKVCI